jgi:hypothetical protein
MRIRTKALLTGLVLAFVLPVTGFMGVAHAASDISFNQQKMFEYGNQERSARGIAPLARDSGLDAGAQEWAEKLAAQGRMYHRSQIYSFSLGYHSGGENLAWHDYSMTASVAHNLWMASDVHRKDMLDPAFTHAGFGIACSTQSGHAYVIAVVEFGGEGKPADSVPSTQPHVAGGDPLTGHEVDCSGDLGESLPSTPPPTASAAPVSPAAALPSASDPASHPSPSPVAKAASKPGPSTAASPWASASPSIRPSARPTSIGPLKSPPAAPLVVASSPRADNEKSGGSSTAAQQTTPTSYASGSVADRITYKTVAAVAFVAALLLLAQRLAGAGHTRRTRPIRSHPRHSAR